MIEGIIMDIVSQMITAFTIGFVGGAVPGPILTSAMAESLRRGFTQSLSFISKAMLAEVILASFILAAFTYLDVNRAFFYLLSFAGAVVLLWFAAQMWKIRDISEGGDIFSFKKIFLLMFGNGLFWIYWLTVCVPLAFAMRQNIFLGQVIFLAAFEAGWLASTAGVVFVFSRFRPILEKNNLVPIAFKLFSVVFVLFAVRITWESVVFFIR